MVTVDDGGDVIAAGEFFGIAARETVSVIKLSGVTGRSLWRQDLDIAWRTSAMALDASGDVFLAVSTIEPQGKDFGVVKLSGSSGAVLWVDRESGSERRYQEAARVLTEASGDVFAAGMIDDGAGSVTGPEGHLFTVVRLDGTTGSRRWAYHTAGTAGGGFAHQLQLGAPGLLIAGGSTQGAKTCADVRIVALDSDTGALVWSRTFDGTYVQRFAGTSCSPDDTDGGGPGPPRDDESLGAMVTDARGRVFAGIALTNRTSAGVRDVASIRRLSAH